MANLAPDDERRIAGVRAQTVEPRGQFWRVDFWMVLEKRRLVRKVFVVVNDELVNCAEIRCIEAAFFNGLTV